MKMTGDNLIPAPPKAVWAALNDPEVLRQAIPGCESLEKLSDTEMKATVALKIGPMSARFSGNVTLADLDPPNGYTISGSGNGGVAGSAKGGAKVRLVPEGDGTRLSYDVDAQVMGKLAQLGSRLIDSTAKMLAGQFFDRFSAIVAANNAPAVSEAGAAGAAAIPSKPSRDGIPGIVWIGLTATIVAVIAYTLLR